MQDYLCVWEYAADNHSQYLVHILSFAPCQHVAGLVAVCSILAPRVAVARQDSLATGSRTKHCYHCSYLSGSQLNVYAPFLCFLSTTSTELGSLFFPGNFLLY